MLATTPIPTPIKEPSIYEIEKPFTSKPFHVAPPLPPPQENLDVRSYKHLQSLIRQALKEVYVDVDTWEKVLTEVALEIAQDVPFALEIIGRPSSNGMADDGSTSLHHVIKVTTEPFGMPQESRYVPGPAEGEIPPEVVAIEPNILELGGTVVLKGTAKDLPKIEKVMELVVFVVCNLKLEMYLFRDHFAVRPDSAEANAVHRSPPPPRRVGRSLWNWIRGENRSGHGSNPRSASPEGVVDGSNRFDRAIRQIEKTIISASPDVIFPPPHLLLRLRDEEVNLYPVRMLDQDGRRISYGPDDVDFPSGSGSGKFNSWGSNSPGRRYSSASTKSTSSRTSHISVDSKAGLGYLMTNNNSISGVMRHQSVTFAYSYYFSGSNIPCRPPEILTIEYYQKLGQHFQDRSLGQFVELLCNKAKGLCPDAMCGKPMGQHVITYTHNHGRISVSVREAPQRLGSPPEPDQIYMWTGCRECESTTDIVPMSTGTWHYSFAKYLELLYYNPYFVCGTVCSHIHTRENVRRFFRLRNEIVVFEYDYIDLFEMRVPKIQVSPDYYFDEASDDAHYGADDDLEPFGVDGHAILEQTRGEITTFYNSVKEYMQGLAFATGSALVAQNEGSAEQVQCQIMLDELGKKFEQDEQQLREELKAKKVAEVNNVRRELLAKMKETVKTLVEWQKLHAPGHKEQPEWSLPDYCSIPGHKPKTGHVYPNSFVIVREDEPTSIIAFTLSSKDYIQHIRNQRQYPFGVDPESPPPIPQWENVGGDCEVKMKVFSHEQTPGGPKQHIKYKFRQGKHNFSCTVYYAAQFDGLRRKCGMSAMYVRSLMRCSEWNASGGKSRAGFFKTCDDQLVVKQLASKWSNQEKAALMKFAPAYFEYMNNSDKNPTILVKIFGFYTLKHKNLQTGTVKKLDVLVMEHLFANVNISRKFDLKGVPDRHIVSKKDGENDVMWDGDWVDGRYKQLLRLHAHSKKIIAESVWNDTQFLSDANVMDYSLLVGVNDDKKELVVGIVDFIGPYTWYKILETRAKTTLNAALKGGKDVTVLPPDQYRDRFRKAMEQNFLMVPDKWIKIPGLEQGISSKKLPSVL
ncbi:uncharacterized protein SPPG_04921 [Spizellomyces punctatus DAOM BR117]|uniref:PIPK domain-containing protein n=1 Tax=Spizellomyces punctatus (strain DAOM BR117) TaxID=645134 RepID=A0A0L0HDH9_SPIPD|nr:hypothetical protein, variant [Spizellomyces punctatus DAOM BR117]XP_016607571.1 uncharacterized protein SPPG_04921 [Spizellomyces punctatus DAOM BR117]KNC99530.1 hypothetical protein, variant [Spizellomyces punctatus DAOM BR117]KNC99531.1 hypothetical protein SPPG_04921 [Spizellomyces punctatus DAOM BR117]|eukprot:XP_016607570.1 hypothetical protein, variant [Spizellomyces punctatus DAOM BR117]